MIVQEQDRPLPLRLLQKGVSGDRARETATDDDEIVGLASRRRAGHLRFIQAIADPVTGADYIPCIAIGDRVIANAAVTCPGMRGSSRCILLARTKGLYKSGCRSTQKCRATTQCHRVDEIAPRDIPFHAKFALLEAQGGILTLAEAAVGSLRALVRFDTFYRCPRGLSGTCRLSSDQISLKKWLLQIHSACRRARARLCPGHSDLFGSP